MRKGEGAHQRLIGGVALQGQRDWRTGTFGSHYRTKGQGARKQSESGSEVPDAPTGAVVNLHISTQEGASQSCPPPSAFANNNILPGTQLVRTSVAARATADDYVFSGTELIALEKLELLARDLHENLQIFTIFR